MWRLIPKLAITNLLKNRRIYYPFALMSCLATTIAYLFISLNFNPHLAKVWGAHGVGMVMSFGMIVVMLAIAMMILYANGFVLKQRSKELGLYSILGLEKKHLLLMTLVETLLFGSVMTLCGLVFGVGLDSLIYAILLKVMQVEVVLVSTFQWVSVGVVILYFAGIYLVTCLLNAGKLGLSSSLQLVNYSKKGEKKGRLLWLQTVLGLGILGWAYYIAQDVSSPTKAMSNFFIAVLMVILATYLLFNAGTISFLRILQKRPSYYYQPANFISVSNLVFRMRKNAIGLSTIAILSTMVLVTLVGAINIYSGGHALVKREAPNDFVIQISNSRDDQGQGITDAEKAETYGRELLTKLEIPIKKEISYTVRGAYLEDADANQLTPAALDVLGGEPIVLVLFSQEDFKEMTGRRLDLAKDQVAIYQDNVQVDPDKPLKIADKTVTINQLLTEDFSDQRIPLLDRRVLGRALYIVVNDVADFLDAESESYYLGYETNLSVEEQRERATNLYAQVGNDERQRLFSAITANSQADTMQSYFALAGSLLFIGVFLTLVFLMATILVIYYKQISEGYEDRNRFKTMQQLGLDEKETKGSIRKQLLTVFFLPIVVALVHLGFAFKMLTAILQLLGISGREQLLTVTLVCCALYTGIYFLVYVLTSQSYRKMLEEPTIS